MESIGYVDYMMKLSNTYLHDVKYCRELNTSLDTIIH